MFCPNCGKPDQKPETFCRFCGKFLPNFEKLKKKEATPEEHLIVNSVLNAMTGIASLTLAVLLYTFFLGKEDTPILIYVTAGFLTAIFAWQCQVFWRNLQLKKLLAKRNFEAGDIPELKETSKIFEPPTASPKSLPEAQNNAFIPLSVTEYTTKELAEKLPRRSS